MSDVEPADLILSGGRIITADSRFSMAEALAIRAGRFIAVGEVAMVRRHTAPHTRQIDLNGRAVLPGLIDGHAHMDREGLKDVFPSLAGCRSIAAIQARIAALAKDKAPGEWIVTMPVGELPFYFDLPESLAEGRWPTRVELDDAAPRNPVYIRPIWGFWRHSLPLVSIANTTALRLAGITRETAPPHPSVTIEKDAAGEPNGVIIEAGYVPLMELAAFRMAPGFTHAHRVAGLPKAAALYHAFGTTSIYEAHGVAAELLAAYREVHAAGRLTMRSHLALSPDWRGMEGVPMERLIGGWAHQLAGAGLGDDMLRLSGLITEIGRTPENALRAQAAPYTGWAGFNYDMGLERERAREMLIACARHGIRAIGIWPNMLDLYAEVNEVVPIRDLRWVLGHIAVLSREQVHRIRDLGLALSTHTNRYIYKEGHALKERHGLADEESISPLRWLEEAGVPFALATDNVPVSLFHPIWQAVSRQSMVTGRPVGAGQAISRESALRAATNAGAWLTLDERQKGSIEVGKLADLAVLTDDPLTVELSALKDVASVLTMVGGEVVHGNPAALETHIAPST